MATEEMEGYDVEVIQEISSDLYCVICLKLMRNPVQFMCGHGMCYVCFQSLLRRSPQRSSAQCPQCREIVKKTQIVSNVMLHRLILSLSVRCLNHERGCKWTGELDRYEVHFNQCTRTPDNPSNNKKGKKKKAKKESSSIHDSHHASSMQNELLLQITEQLDKLNERLIQRVSTDNSSDSAATTTTKDDQSDTWFNHFFVKSVTASCKTKFLALFLFTISLLSGMHLLGNPLWDTASSLTTGGFPSTGENLQKGFHQLQTELTKINSLIYAQQNNFFQLHLGSKELQTELETQRNMFLKLLGLHMRNTLQDAHFKKASLYEHVTDVLNDEVLTARELEQKWYYELEKIEMHMEKELKMAEKQPLDIWLLKTQSREQFLHKVRNVFNVSRLDMTRSLRVANETSRSKLKHAFQEARRKLNDLNKRLTDFDGFSYVDVKEYMMNEFSKSDVVINDKINEAVEQSSLNLLSMALKFLDANLAILAQQTVEEYQRKTSYEYQFSALVTPLENVDTKNGHFIWSMNTSTLSSLTKHRGYYSKPFTAVAPRTPLEPARVAKLWFTRGGSRVEDDLWQVTYEQDDDTPVMLNVSVLNHLGEEYLPCNEMSREVMADSKKMVVDFLIPMKMADLVANGYVKDDEIIIRCTVVPK